MGDFWRSLWGCLAGGKEGGRSGSPWVIRHSILAQSDLDLLDHLRIFGLKMSKEIVLKVQLTIYPFPYQRAHAIQYASY